jgi:hypothetical protein
MRKILAGGNPSHGRNGYYLAASGSVAVSLKLKTQNIKKASGERTDYLFSETYSGMICILPWQQLWQSAT